MSGGLVFDAYELRMRKAAEEDHAPQRNAPSTTRGTRATELIRVPRSLAEDWKPATKSDGGIPTSCLPQNLANSRISGPTPSGQPPIAHYWLACGFISPSTCSINLKRIFPALVFLGKDFRLVTCEKYFSKAALVAASECFNINRSFVK